MRSFLAVITDSPIRFISIILVVITACGKTNRFPSDSEKEKEIVLKNHIRVIRVSQINYMSGTLQQERLYQEKFFDQDGNKTREVDYDDHGGKESEILYQYNDHNDLIQSKGINADSSIFFRDTISYDENNRRKELYHFLPDGNYKYRNITAYDQSGKMASLSWYWPDGLKAVNRYTYDDQLLTEDVEYDPKGNLNTRWQHHYDKQGNLIQSVQFLAGNKISVRKNYQYRNRLLVEEQITSGNSLQKKYTYEYNSNHLLAIKLEFLPSGTLISKFIYSYEFY